MRKGTLVRWYAFRKIFLSEIKKNARIIDLGGYDGAICSNLIKLKPDIKATIVDLDKLGLDKAKSRGLKTIKSSALNVPLDKEEFDCVLCLSLIEHIEKPEKLIKEAHRLLKSKGKIFLITPKENGVLFPLIEKEKSTKINRDWGHIYRLGFSFQELHEILDKGGFKIEKRVEYYNFFTKTFYLISYFKKSSLLQKITDLLYSLVINLEPYIKYKTDSQLIIATKKI